MEQDNVLSVKKKCSNLSILRFSYTPKIKSQKKIIVLLLKLLTG